MKTYIPKTTEWMRQNNWGAEAQQLVTADLTSCESCLAEAEREIARLKKREAELVEAGDAMYTWGDFTRATFNVDSNWAKLNWEGRDVSDIECQCSGSSQTVCSTCYIDLLQQLATLTQERDALREENTRLREYIGVMDAALKIPDGASTTAERCKRTNSLIGSDDWMEEPACSCVVCIDHVLTPSGEAGKGGEV